MYIYIYTQFHISVSPKKGHLFRSLPGPVGAGLLRSGGQLGTSEAPGAAQTLKTMEDSSMFDSKTQL